MKNPILRNLLIMAAMGAAACGSASGSASAPGNQADGLPPLIDRALFFGDPIITSAQLSPDGQHLAFIKPYRDVRNIWVKRVDEGFDRARPLTADARPVPGYFWSHDGRYILYVQDKGGNENFHIHAVDPAAPAVADTGVPAARNLTDIEGVRALIYAVPRTDPDIIMIGLNHRDAAHHDVYRLRLSTGERTLVMENTQKLMGYTFDHKGQVRLALRQTADGGQEVLRVDGKKLVPIFTTTYEESVQPVRIHPDGARAYIQTNQGDTDLARLMLLHLRTGKTELVHADPEDEVDLGWSIFHEDTDELLATIYAGDRQRVYPQTNEVRRDFEVLTAQFPDEEISVRSTTRDLSRWLVDVSSDVNPGSMYLYERESGAINLLYHLRPDLPPEQLAFMKPIRYTARDGLSIPAYLTLPRGAEARDLPVVIQPHGGPWARDYWGYDAYAQFLANRGYAVLQPNFRGSAGFGKAFLNAGNRGWGTGAMQHDISDGVKWLIDQGIADPERVCIFGGSYGGYATLAGVAFTPELYACGIPYVAPSNLITLLESFPVYWRPFAKVFSIRVGDPAVEEDRRDLEARSPINFVDRIRVPLLVVHGANDPRVTQIESDQIVTALRDKGHPVEYIVAPDEGHGFRSPENRMALAVAMERFLGRHLGGRVQEDVPAAIQQHLAAITVDVRTVKKPDPEARKRAEAAMAAPLPDARGAAIKPASLTYALRLAMGEQTMDMTMQSLIEAPRAARGPAVWRITDTADTPMGKSVDRFELDKATLRPLRRTLSGVGTGEVRYQDDAVTGTLGAMGQSADIRIPLKAPVFGDGPGLVLAVAGLPLAEGYETTLRQLALQVGKVEAYHLVVTGTETVEVPAGRFDTFVVELRPLGDATGGGVMRVMSKAPHFPVRAEYKLPTAMGGGTMTTELTATR